MEIAGASFIGIPMRLAAGGAAGPIKHVSV
jgi:hypothetical protein